MKAKLDCCRPTFFRIIFRNAKQHLSSSAVYGYLWDTFFLTSSFWYDCRGDEPSVAAQSLEELLKMEPNNLQTQAQLVLAYAKFDLSKALAVSKKLPKFSYQGGVVDIDALEESSFVR